MKPPGGDIAIGKTGSGSKINNIPSKIYANKDARAVMSQGQTSRPNLFAQVAPS